MICSTYFASRTSLKKFVNLSAVAWIGTVFNIITAWEEKQINMKKLTCPETKLQNNTGMVFLTLKLPGRDGSWMGDYATCGSCHLAHAARFALAPRLLQCYDRGVSRTN